MASMEIHKGKILLTSFSIIYIWLIMFLKVSNGFWESKSNQRSYFDWLGKQIGILKMDDWYDKSSQDVIRHGGRTLLNK
jgi:hypothetical protein